MARTRGEPPGVREATSDCADIRPHSVLSTPPPSTAAAVLMEALSPLRCVAHALLCPTTPTLLAPPSCCRQDWQCYNHKYYIDKNTNKQTNIQLHRQIHRQVQRENTYPLDIKVSSL